MFTNKDLFLIQQKLQQGCSVEQLSIEFQIDEETIILLQEDGTLDTEQVSCYDTRENQCGKCGSSLNPDGIPTNCLGDCEADDATYFSDDYPETDSTPLELDFN